MAAKKSTVGRPKRLHGIWYHPTGGYAKKFRGKTYYFGKDPDVAAKRFAEDWPIIQAGGVPNSGDNTTIRDLCNRFLTDREARVERGDLSPRSFDDYHRTCKQLVSTFGKATPVDSLQPVHFGKLRRRLETTRGPVALKNAIGHVKVVFNFADKNFIIDQPVRYGTQLDPPSARKMRQAGQQRGPLLFSPDDVATLLPAYKPVLRAMMLLGLNGGFGKSDLARLPSDVVDLQSGWLDYASHRLCLTGLFRLE